MLALCHVFYFRIGAAADREAYLTGLAEHLAGLSESEWGFMWLTGITGTTERAHSGALAHVTERARVHRYYSLGYRIFVV